jgi:hypothetical protein
MRRFPVRIFAAAGIVAAAPSAALGGDVTFVASCPAQPAIPMKFMVDCSHVKDASDRQLCEPFIVNQACKVFPAYQKITGVRLDHRCQVLTYRIYDQDNFPYPDGSGGLSYRCRIDYMTEHALRPYARSSVGPYDTHEILHHYHMTIPVLTEITGMHVLFGPSMAEVQALIGDNVTHDKTLGRIRSEPAELRAMLGSGKVRPDAQCNVARNIIENELYVADTKNVYEFYRRLVSIVPRNVGDRTAGYDSVLNDVAGGKAKAFLSAYGCKAF